jgi:hypothetical protein
LKQILTPRDVEAEILGINASDEFNRIQSIFIASTKAKADWFLSYMKTVAQPGEPLPYHQDFGISKEEYEKYLSEIKQHKFEPVGMGRLRFIATSDGTTRIESVEGLRELDGLVFDLKHQRVETQWGTITLDNPVHTDENAALGSWIGFSGRQQSGEIESGAWRLLKFYIGRQTQSPHNIVCLSVRVAENGVKTASVETVIRFP